MRNHRTRRRFGRHSIAIFLALVGVVLHAARAEAYQAHVRWLPKVEPNAVGYRVYVRQAFTTYSAPIDVGKPPKAPDGSMSWDVGGLVSGRTYYFAVTSYTSTREGLLSREIAIGATEPCVIDQCFTGTICQVGVEDDGVSCGNGPCDVCRFSRCTTVPSLDLQATAHIARRSDGVHARWRGRLVPTAHVDPTITGVVLRFADFSGTLLLEIPIPAEALKANATGRRFRLASRDAVGGMRRFNLWLGSDRARVSFVLQGWQFEDIAENPYLAWAMRFGSDMCAVDPDLICTGARCR